MPNGKQMDAIIFITRDLSELVATWSCNDRSIIGPNWFVLQPESVFQCNSFKINRRIRICSRDSLRSWGSLLPKWAPGGLGRGELMGRVTYPTLPPCLLAPPPRPPFWPEGICKWSERGEMLNWAGGWDATPVRCMPEYARLAFLQGGRAMGHLRLAMTRNPRSPLKKGKMCTISRLEHQCCHCTSLPVSRAYLPILQWTHIASVCVY